jgi:hypothetical protein
VSRPLVALVVAVLAVGCGTSPTRTGAPADDGASGSGASGSGTSRPGAGVQRALGAPGCPAVVGADDPDPFGVDHPTLAGDWFRPLAEAVDSGERARTGGLYLDQHAGQVVVVATGDDPAATVDELRGLVPEPHRDAVACRHGAWSQDDLEAVLATAVAATDGPTSAGIDTVRNRVEVQLETGDPADLRAAVAGEHGPDAAAALAIDVPDCAEVIADPPAGAVELPGEGSTCSGMDALAEGVLGGDPATGCLVLEHGDGVAPTALLFPRGYTVTSDGVVHDNLGAVWAELGEEVAVGGGGVPVDDGDDPCDAGELGAFLLSGAVTRR